MDIYDLRNKNMIKQPLRIRNHYGEATFSVFFSKLINFLLLTDLNCNFNTFINRLNINNVFSKFVTEFNKFNMFYSPIIFFFST